MGEDLPQRTLKSSHHTPPAWVAEYETYSITICCQRRGIDSLTQHAEKLFESILFYHEKKKWFVELFLIMPDHIHALIVFREPMTKVIASWKKYTSHVMKIRWQRDFFDHRCRGSRGSSEQWYYIRENPVKAELVTSYEEWPHVWRPPNQIGW